MFFLPRRLPAVLPVALVLVIIALFGWAIYSGQLDHLEGEGERILQDDD